MNDDPEMGVWEEDEALLLIAMKLRHSCALTATESERGSFLSESENRVDRCQLISGPGHLPHVEWHVKH
ncbi:hypothetical protein ACSQ67_012378 [Phaseolus vulgaris]